MPKMPEIVKEIATLILEDTIAIVAMGLFLACLAVWAATFCRLL